MGVIDDEIDDLIKRLLFDAGDRKIWSTPLGTAQALIAELSDLGVHPPNPRILSLTNDYQRVYRSKSNVS
jgi:hypothetical protein